MIACHPIRRRLCLLACTCLLALPALVQGQSQSHGVLAVRLHIDGVCTLTVDAPAPLVLRTLEPLLLSGRASPYALVECPGHFSRNYLLSWRTPVGWSGRLARQHADTVPSLNGLMHPDVYALGVSISSSTVLHQPSADHPALTLMLAH